MFTLSGLLSALLSLLARTFSNVIVQEIDAVRAANAQRQVGADSQIKSSTIIAEAQEARARAAGDAIGATPVPADDPDMRSD